MPPKTDKAEPVDKGPDEAEVRQQALVASTFANVELQSTKATLAQYVSLYNNAREENARLQHDMQERDKDAMTVVQFLRNDLDKRQEQLKEAKRKAADDLEAQKAEFGREREQLQEEMAGRDKTISGLQEQVASLHADLDALAAFRRERHDMHLELSRLRDEHQRTVEKYEAEISKQRFLSLEEKVRLKAEERGMEERFDREVNDRAMKLLDAKTREIHQENFILLQDKQMLEKELARATDNQQKLSTVAAERQRECELARQADEEHMKRTVVKNREAKDLQQRLKDMEKNLKDTVNRYSGQLTTVKAAAEKDVQRLISERDDAQRTAELIQRDFLKMRQLTRSVVRQRTELETFFTEALDYVRHQVARERTGLIAEPAPAALIMHTSVPSTTTRHAMATTSSTVRSDAAKAKKQRLAPHNFFKNDGQFEAIYRPPQTGEASSSLPPINNLPPSRSFDGTMSMPVGSGVPPMSGADASATMGSLGGAESEAHVDPEGGRVDISQLSWADKERVLRILFAKINATNDARGKRTEAKGPSDSVLPAIDGPRDTVFMTQE